MPPDSDPIDHNQCSAPSSPPESRGMIRSTWGVGALTMCSRVLGLVRDYLLVLMFGGCKWVLDAFLLAFTIPNLFRRLFGEGALTAAFIPVFIKIREDQGDDKASFLASAVFTLLALVTAGIAVAGMLLCFGIGQVVRTDDPLQLTLQLLAVMLPFLCLVCCSALFSAMLQSVRVFSLPAAMSILLNLCFIGSFIYINYGRAGGMGNLTPDRAQQAIFVVACAVLIAGALQLLIQWPALRGKGIRITPSLAFNQQGVHDVLKAFGPTALGLGVVQVNVLVDNILAGTLSFGHAGGAGAVQYLYLGNRLMQLPLGIFGIAVATTAFPFLATHAARNEHNELIRRLGDSIRLLIFVVLPASIGLGVMADPIVRLIFQKPDLVFSDAAVYRTACVLVCYAAGLVFFSLQHLLTRVFYARREYSTPVRVAAWMVGVNLVLNLAFIHAPDLYLRWSGITITGLDRQPLLASDNITWPVLGEAGLALATTITAVFNVMILWHCLKKRMQPHIGQSRWEKMISGLHWSLLRIMAAAAGMGLFVYYTRNSIPYEPELLARLERGLVPMVLGVGGYWIACLVIPVPELDEFVWRKGKSAEKEK